MGHFGQTTLLFIGSERPGTVAVYSISENQHDTAPLPVFETLVHGISRHDDTWQNLYDARAVSMIDPEDIRLVV